MGRLNGGIAFRGRLRRGTLREPGSDLRKMPIGLDLRAISIAEGLRAAVATAAVLFANAWIGSPDLLLAAFAANLTCFCDTGGPVRKRVPALLAFTLLGACLWAALGLLHEAGVALLVGVAGLVVFCNSMARVWGARAQAVGNVLTVVLALAVDHPLDPTAALRLFGAFLGGGAWAILLTIGIWRIQPSWPVSRTLAGNWRLVAALARDLAGLLAGKRVSSSDWDAHARAHRRAVRDALEEARPLVLAFPRPPGPMSPEGARSLLTLEAQDHVFGALIALSDSLEATTDLRIRATARNVLRRTRPILLFLSRDEPGDAGRYASALDRMEAEGGEASGLRGAVGTLADGLRLAVRLRSEAAVDGLGFVDARPELRAEAVLRSLLENLTWRSAVLRHALRAAVLTMAAVWVTLTWWSPYAHWLTITVALTMQPYFASTWQRAIERMGGTMLGALIGGALAFVPQTPLNTSLLLFPLCVLGFSVRQVSYGAYIACLTPLTVLLFEVAEPGHSEWVIAGMRLVYTLGGGIVAVLACVLLWPSWEPGRTESEVRTALLAHAAYAEAVLSALSGTTTAHTLEATRRAAGVASNNLETSLSRALHEPRRRRGRRLEIFLSVDATLRRIAGALVALQHDRESQSVVSEPTWILWQSWLPSSLRAMAERQPQPLPAPDAPSESTLARIARGVELLDSLLCEAFPETVAAVRAIVPPERTVGR